jgi:hypothetical protein
MGEMKHSGEIFFNDGPTLFIEVKSEVVRTRGFVFMKLVQGSAYFFFLYGLV